MSNWENVLVLVRVIGDPSGFVMTGKLLFAHAHGP